MPMRHDQDHKKNDIEQRRVTTTPRKAGSERPPPGGRRQCKAGCTIRGPVQVCPNCDEGGPRAHEARGQAAEQTNARVAPARRPSPKRTGDPQFGPEHMSVSHPPRRTRYRRHQSARAVTAATAMEVFRSRNRCNGAVIPNRLCSDPTLAHEQRLCSGTRTSRSVVFWVARFMTHDLRLPVTGRSRASMLFDTFCDKGSSGHSGKTKLFWVL